LHEIIPSSRAICAHAFRFAVCGPHSARTLRASINRGPASSRSPQLRNNQEFASGMPAFSLRVTRGNVDGRKRNAALGGGSIFRAVMQALRNRRDGGNESVRKSQA
jgi:hypothetical protein